MCILVVIILLSFLFSGGNSDIFAHLGGFLAGVCCGLFLSPLYQSPAAARQFSLEQYSMRKHQKIMFGTGIGCYVCMLALMVLLM